MKPHELELLETFIQNHPSAAARELEAQPPESASFFITELALPYVRTIFAHILPPYAARLCEQIPVQTAADILCDLNTDQITAILRCLVKDKQNTLLKALPDRTAGMYRLLLSYSEDSVGAWMKADTLMLPLGLNASEALNRIGSHSGATWGDFLPVVDDQLKIQGLVSTASLLGSSTKTPIAHLLESLAPTLQSRTSLLTAVRHQHWLQHDIVWVLNRNNQLVGLLRHVDLRKGLDGISNQEAREYRENFSGVLGQAYVGALAAMFDLFNVGQTSRYPPAGDRS